MNTIPAPITIRIRNNMAKITESFKGIRKNVVVLGLASFFTDISSEMLYPVIPIFLTAVLGAPMSVVGLIEEPCEHHDLLLVVDGEQVPKGVHYS